MSYISLLSVWLGLVFLWFTLVLRPATNFCPVTHISFGVSCIFQPVVRFICAALVQGYGAEDVDKTNKEAVDAIRRGLAWVFVKTEEQEKAQEPQEEAASHTAMMTDG